MTAPRNSVDVFVDQLRQIVSEETDDAAITKRVSPLAVALAADRSWFREEFRETDPEQGFSVHMLHEEENHDLAVTVISWAPGKGLAAHNHRTWAVVSGIEGEEEETSYIRHDDGGEKGYADLSVSDVRVLRPGQVATCQPDDIHSVRNTGDVVSVSLHVYGRHLNHTGRSVFDVEAKTETPLVVQVT